MGSHAYWAFPSPLPPGILPWPLLRACLDEGKATGGAWTMITGKSLGGAAAHTHPQAHYHIILMCCTRQAFLTPLP